MSADKIVSTIKKLAYPAGTKTSMWKYNTGEPTTAYKLACKKYMKKSGRINFSDCGYFVSTVVRMVGIDPKFMALSGVGKPFPTAKKFNIVHSGKKVPKSILKPGDIIRYKTTTGQHVLFYMGNGYIAEAGRGKRFPVIRKSKKYNGTSVRKNTIQVLRLKED